MDMDQIEERIKDLTEIRSMMERSSKFLSLSGLAGVSAGIVALVGAAAAYYQLKANYAAAQPTDLRNFFMLDAGAMLVFALGFAIFFSTRMARRKNIPVWIPTTKYLLQSLFIPLGAGGAFCCILWYHELFELIAPVTLIFYGLALLNSSKFTVNEIRYLALGEIVLGLLAAFFLDHWLILWALGFGVLHIVYGIFIYVKYEK